TARHQRRGLSRASAPSVVPRMAELAEHFAIELHRQRLPVRVRTRPVERRADAELALLADVPVLAVGPFPEVDPLCGVELGSRERVWMEKPVAGDAGAPRRLRPERVEHHVVGVEADEEIRENRVVVNAPWLFR